MIRTEWVLRTTWPFPNSVRPWVIIRRICLSVPQCPWCGQIDLLAGHLQEFPWHLSISFLEFFFFPSLFTHSSILWPSRVTGYMPRALCIPMHAPLTISLRIRKHPCSLSIKSQCLNTALLKEIVQLPIFPASRSSLHPHFYVLQQLKAYSSQTSFLSSSFYVL